MTRRDRNRSGACFPTWILAGALALALLPASRPVLAQAPPAAPGAPPADLVTTVAAFLKLKDPNAKPRFRHVLTDLNGDGVDEGLVLLSGNEYCGTGGCTLLVLRGTGSGFAVITRMTVTSEPIRVSPDARNGWKSLIVHTRGAESLMVFNGKTYPANPSVQPTATPAQIAAAAVVIQ